MRHKTMELAQSYSSTIAAFGCLGLLMFCQLLVADIVGLRSKHLPGSTVPVDHGNLLFRTTRTVANTNESIAVFILAALFCMLSGASPATTGYAAWAFVIARSLYALCYYFNLQPLRSVMFGISLFAMGSLLVIGSLMWL